MSMTFWEQRRREARARAVRAAEKAKAVEEATAEETTDKPKKKRVTKNDSGADSES